MLLNVIIVSHPWHTLLPRPALLAFSLGVLLWLSHCPMSTPAGLVFPTSAHSVPLLSHTTASPRHSLVLPPLRAESGSYSAWHRTGLPEMFGDGWLECGCTFWKWKQQRKCGIRLYENACMPQHFYNDFVFRKYYIAMISFEVYTSSVREAGKKSIILQMSSLRLWQHVTSPRSQLESIRAGVEPEFQILPRRLNEWWALLCP